MANVHSTSGSSSTLAEDSVRPSETSKRDAAGSRQTESQETGGTLSSGPITRSVSMWFDDGNIILQAENVQFLVHKSVLSRHSSVFRGMLSLPAAHTDQSPMNMDQMVDGRPLVHVWDDPFDLEHFLTALYDPFAQPWSKPLHRTTFPMLSATLRLSNKYLVAKLRKAVSEVFLKVYSSDLSTWDNPAMGNTVESHLTANLFEEANLWTGLPSALYECDFGDPESIFESVLSPANKKRLLGSLRLIQAQYHKMLTTTLWEFNPVKGCENVGRGTCKPATREMFHTLMGQGLNNIIHPLTVWKDLARKCPNSGLCTACAQQCRVTWTDCRLDCWKKLPEFFKVGTWDELKKKDALFQEDMEKGDDVERDGNMREAAT